MKNNYPVKYAIMPIFESTSWHFGYCDLACYIVSKCYLLGENKSYLENGDLKYEYDVFFPYERVYREIYDFKGINSLNDGKVSTVDVVFDTYAKAREYADVLNAEAINHQLRNYETSSEKEKIKDYYKILMNKYKILEQKISQLTDDMEIDYVPKKQRIVVGNGNNYNILANSIYEFLTFALPDDYIVYHVSEKDMERYRQKEITELSEKDLLLVKSEPGFVRINCHNNDSGTFVIENGKIGFNKDLKTLERKKYKYKVYTTETLDEIITSYSSRENISVKKVCEEHNRRILTRKNK